VTWCCRKYRKWAIALTALNILMIAATFMSGAHYFIDIVATLLLFAVSAFVYRRWCSGLVGGETGPNSSAELRNLPSAIS
jgi:cobalamin synthase